MRCTEFIRQIESWAPKEIAWQNDNPGLQVGSSEREAGNIFLCLELTDNAVKEAVKKKCKFIFTHHPLIFSPLKKIDTHQNKISRLIQTLILNNITLYSAHTNLDFTKDGVSFMLAKKLELKNIRFLRHLEDTQLKLVVFVPESHVKVVADAIFASGGGIIGEYKKCSYRLEGTGSFEGSDSANPFIGAAGKYEEIEETRLEVIVNRWALNKVVSSMLEVHPYEEPAYDIYPVHNKAQNYGNGAIGELAKDMTEKDFLVYVKEKLNLANYRFARGTGKKVKTIAVCGGSGSELLETAISKNADAFVTADIKYHPFQDAAGRILLIDAGHYETEIFCLEEVKKRLEDFIKKNKSGEKVYQYTGTTNPIEFYKN